LVESRKLGTNSARGLSAMLPTAVVPLPHDLAGNVQNGVRSAKF